MKRARNALLGVLVGGLGVPVLLYAALWVHHHVILGYQSEFWGDVVALRSVPAGLIVGLVVGVLLPAEDR